jgi:guanine deaminase
VDVAIYKGVIISPTPSRGLEVYDPGFMVVDEEGMIREISSHDPSRDFPDHRFVDCSGHLLIPGFVDLHTHLPQYAIAGVATKRSLLEWLRYETFPREAAFADPEVASLASERFFRDLIANGTTTVLAYATVHKQAAAIAFEAAAIAGLRAGIGKVMMDQNAPASLLETTEQNVRETRELIERFHGDGKRFYVLTPRFALSCSRKLLEAAGALAREYDLPIQTHLAEHPEETAAVRRLFGVESYTELYRQTGLLGEKTILAHAIHLDETELRTLQSAGAKIAHCPTSNRFLSSGTMPLGCYMERGLTIGLGTDVAGGYTLSMFSEMREALESSKTFRLYVDPDARTVTVGEAFYLATLGGAVALGMEERIGSLERGKAADFLVVDWRAADPERGKGRELHPEELLSLCIYRGSEHLIEKVYVQGRKLKERRATGSCR